MDEYLKNYDYKMNNCRKTKLQVGCKIASVNVRGLVAKHNQRLDLYLWTTRNDVDIVCIQEPRVNYNNQIFKFDKSLYKGYDKWKIDIKTRLFSNKIISDVMDDLNSMKKD